MSEAAVSHYLTEYDRFRDVLAASWPAQRRADALEYLKTHGFPTRRTEQWKYTDVSPITRRKFTLGKLPEARVVDAPVEKLRFSRLNCHELVFINGSFSTELSRNLRLPSGATVRALQSDGNAELLERYFGNEEIGHAFTALNTAFLNDGVLVHVPDGMDIPEPIHIIYLGGRDDETQPSQPSPMSHPRNLIALGRQASASIIETYAGIPDSEYFTNSYTSIRAQAGARLDYYKIQQESRRAYHIGRTRISQQADSRVDCHALSLGGKLARWDIDAELVEPGAEINLNGLYLTSDRHNTSTTIPW